MQVYVMSARAQKKFRQLDTNDNSTLERREVRLLAEWVWSSFHGGAAPSEEVRAGGTYACVGRRLWVCDRGMYL